MKIICDCGNTTMFIGKTLFDNPLHHIGKFKRNNFKIYYDEAELYIGCNKCGRKIIELPEGEIK